MDYKAARKLASDMSIWFFQNNSTVNKLSNIKQSDKNLSMSDISWAELMTEAIVSFYDGLELDNKKASNQNEETYNKVVSIVGSDAFNNIAFIVSAARIRGSIIEKNCQDAGSEIV